MKFTKEDIEKIEKFIDIKNRGYYADGGQVTSVYNRVLEKNVNVTNCGSCLRGRIQELENALNHFKELTKRQEELKAQEALKDAQVDNSSSDENKEVVEEKKRPGRPPKKTE
jgi:hypothetical protein